MRLTHLFDNSYLVSADCGFPVERIQDFAFPIQSDTERQKRMPRPFPADVRMENLQSRAELFDIREVLLKRKPCFKIRYTVTGLPAHSAKQTSSPRADSGAIPATWKNALTEHQTEPPDGFVHFGEFASSYGLPGVPCLRSILTHIK